MRRRAQKPAVGRAAPLQQFNGAFVKAVGGFHIKIRAGGPIGVARHIQKCFQCWRGEGIGQHVVTFGRPHNIARQHIAQLRHHGLQLLVARFTGGNARVGKLGGGLGRRAQAIGFPVAQHAGVFVQRHDKTVGSAASAWHAQAKHRRHYLNVVDLGIFLIAGFNFEQIDEAANQHFRRADHPQLRQLTFVIDRFDQSVQRRYIAVIAKIAQTCALLCLVNKVSGINHNLAFIVFIAGKAAL